MSFPVPDGGASGARGAAARFGVPSAFAALLLGCAAPAGAEVSFVPLPAFDVSPNEGATYGVQPTFLFHDRQGAVRHIISPSLTYNRILGVDATLRYLLFPAGGEHVEAAAGVSTRGGRDVSASYEGSRIGPDGRYYLSGQARFERDPTARFFGIGPATPKEDETNFTRREASAFLTVGLNIASAWRSTLTDRLRDVRVLEGRVPGLPFTGDRFPNVPGVGGGFIHAQRIDLTADTRDDPSVTTSGGFLDLAFELSSRASGSDASFRRAVVDGRLFLPMPGLGERLVTALRAAFESVDGDRVPFFELATLGGETTLRGFGDDRFTDAHSVVLSIEERIRLFTTHVFGTTIEVQAAPFAEAGEVFRRARDLRAGNVAWAVGAGFRALARPTFANHVDIGVGPEGVEAFVGLGFPF